MIRNGRYGAPLRPGMGAGTHEASIEEFSHLGLTVIAWSCFKATVRKLLKDHAVAGSYALTARSSLRSSNSTSMDLIRQTGDSSRWSTAPARHAIVGRSRHQGSGSV